MKKFLLTGILVSLFHVGQSSASCTVQMQYLDGFQWTADTYTGQTCREALRACNHDRMTEVDSDAYRCEKVHSRHAGVYVRTSRRNGSSTVIVNTRPTPAPIHSYGHLNCTPGRIQNHLTFLRNMNSCRGCILNFLSHQV